MRWLHPESRRELMITNARARRSRSAALHVKLAKSHWGNDNRTAQCQPQLSGSVSPPPGTSVSSERLDL